MSAVPVTAGGTGANTAAAAINNLLPGITSDAKNGISVLGSVAPSGLIPKTSPYADIRAHGAVIDKSTPVDTALQNATNAQCLPSTTNPGGTGCGVVLPCTGVGCLWQTPENYTYSGTGTLVLELQGTIFPESTIELPDNITFEGIGGGSGVQFQARGATATIDGSLLPYGTLGTAVTSINTPVSFSPTVIGGTAAGVVAGAAITISDPVSISATAVRAADGTTAYSMASYTRIDIGATVNVTGCSDPSFNANSAIIVAADFPAQTLNLVLPGSAGSTNGCTISGPNDDTFETVRLQMCSGSPVSCTATFAHQHSSSALWGMVAVAPVYSTYGHHDFQNLTITNAPGMQMWFEHLGEVNLTNVGTGPMGSPTSGSVEWASGAGAGQTITNSVFSTNTWVISCKVNCYTSSYQYGMRYTYLPTQRNPSGDGVGGGPFNVVQNSLIKGGIKVDTNGFASVRQVGPPNLSNDIIETPSSGGITFDNRFSSPNGPATIDSVWLQDPFISGYQGAENALVATDPVSGYGLTFTAPYVLRNSGKYWSGSKNSYYSGIVQTDQLSGPLMIGTHSPLGIISNGAQIKAEIDGIGAGFGPGVVPYPTLPVTTPVAGTSQCNYGCSITAGIPAPDHTTDAIQITEGFNGGPQTTNVGTQSFATYPGDNFIEWAWVRPVGSGTAASGMSAVI